ncbi:hypothetical protein NA57DRAFT_82149 [Rhizodiscina lignyota]|uniref:Uncharacterized protein n=1 Tax=Rhizodiscina lignyota TaxID=1504668 RepID=A0A9P4I2T5_9PEZI|nr:hypothetical protein NA57DRAFT_82149 [Rhizodiscina lignyota]
MAGHAKPSFHCHGKEALRIRTKQRSWEAESSCLPNPNQSIPSAMLRTMICFAPPTSGPDGLYCSALPGKSGSTYQELAHLAPTTRSLAAIEEVALDVVSLDKSSLDVTGASQIRPLERPHPHPMPRKAARKRPHTASEHSIRTREIRSFRWLGTDLAIRLVAPLKPLLLIPY